MRQACHKRHTFPARASARKRVSAWCHGRACIGAARSGLKSLASVLGGLAFGMASLSAQALTAVDFTNSATITSSSNQYEPVQTNNTSDVLVLPKGMAVTKTADASALSTPTAAGDVITYTITVSNLGLLGLTNVQLADTIIPAANLTLTAGDINTNSVLDANEVWEYTGTYTLTQSDIDNNGGGDGDIDNTVVVTTDELPPMDASADAPITQAPAFIVAKTVDAAAIALPTTLNYVITVTNTGNLTLTGVALTDVLPDGSAASLAGPATDTGIAGALDVGETWTYTTTYNATQADLDAGATLTNVVNVTTQETGSDVQSANAETSVTATPSFVVTKVVDQASIAAPGTLTYSITVENDGNVTLTGINLVDTQPDGSAGSLTGPSGDAGLPAAIDVGETWTYSLTYNVSQAEIDAGNTLVNTVAVTSQETGSTVLSDNAETEVVTEPGLVIDKVVDLAQVSSPGTLNYTITVQNTGNTTLTNPVLADTLPDGTSATLTGPLSDTGTAGAIDVGETWQFSASYTVSQTDVDAGSDLVNNVSVVTDQTPDAQSASATTAVQTAPALSVSKSVDLASINTPQTLSYLIEIENTGNVRLTNVLPVDSLPNGSPVTPTGPLTDAATVGALDVGETWQYTMTYPASQLEIDAGNSLTNTVVVTSDQTPAPVSDTAVTTIDRSPSFTLAKVVDQASLAAPGVLTYTVTLTNTGNVSLSSISINDTLPDGSAAVLTGPAGDLSQATLVDVGESWTWTTTYNVTQADIDAGQLLVNNVTATTLEAGSADASASTAVSQAPGISIDKSSPTTEYITIGDVVEYSMVVTNTGNVALSQWQVSDPVVDPASLVCTPAQLTILLPGAQAVCSATHTVNAIDIGTTTVVNQASVSAEDPQGNPVSNQSEIVIIPMNRVPPVATDNGFVSPVSAVAVTLPAATDDSDANGDLVPDTLSLVHPDATDTDGDGDFDSLVVAGEGTWLVDNATGDVTFTPVAGFTADPTPVPYTVSDATALVSNQALLSIDYPQTAPVAQDDFKANPGVPSPANPTTLNVIADNGSGPDTDPENDLSVTTVNLLHADAVDSDNDGDADKLVVAGEGSWSVDNATGDITFTPEAGFLFDPTPVDYVVSDINGLVSNSATVTIDYPQTAPVAVDDQLLDQPLGQPVTLPTLANDSDPESNIDPTTVTLIDPASGTPVTTLVVAGEGVWQVDAQTGDVTFTPESGFLGDPAPVQYTVFDTTGVESNVATLTITYEEPATLAGTVWLDADRDGQIGPDEDRKAGWTLRLLDSNGNVVATTVTDSNGDYLITGLIPGSYTVEFYNERGVFMDSRDTNGPLLAGQTMNLPLPVDPSGVVYDSISRLPVEQVQLNLRNDTGDLVDPLCLAGNQQGQITSIDGLYAFDIFPGAHPSCPLTGIYFIELADVPDTYHPNYSSIIRQEGAASCGGPLLGCAVSAIFDSADLEAGCTVDSLPGTDACEVQPQPDAPEGTDDTRYYVEFEIASGDQNVIFNHLPLDAKANDAEILLSKSVDRRETSVGGLLRYTLSAENTKDVPAFDVVITDTPPPGFVFEPTSVRLIRSGADEEFGTDDDVVSEHGVSDFTSVAEQTLFDAVTLDPLETVLVSYLMKVGTGVVEGRYTNTASASGPNGVASNTVTAGVNVVADPVLHQATIVGKVFDDRDEDGLQDSADASGVVLKSDFYGWDSLALPDLPGRRSINDNPKDAGVTVNMPLSADNAFRIETDEGTRIEVDGSGTVTETHVGAKARGMNAQDIRVCTRRTEAWPTNKEGFADNSQGKQQVLEVVISNHGISERGLPGVRLATVTGLIIETDGYGRFSIPDVDAGNSDAGRNFILKVDPASLPAGTELTTENPYVLRVFNGGLNRINFGAHTSVGQQDHFSIANDPCSTEESSVADDIAVEVTLGSVFFDTDSDLVREDQEGIVADIIAKLRQYGGGLIVVDANADSRGSAAYNLELAERRAKRLQKRLADELGEELMEAIDIEVDPNGLKESGQ